MRIVTWNCRRAKTQSPLWSVLNDLSPDIVALQEVGEFPKYFHEKYDIRETKPLTKNGKQQRFKSVLMVNGEIIQEFKMRSNIGWVDKQIDFYRSQMPAYDVNVKGWGLLRVLPIYSPAWPLARSIWKSKNVNGIKLNLNRDLWVADLLVAGMLSILESCSTPIILAGDFNSCVSFDNWSSKPRGNQEWMERMSKLGFTESLAFQNERLVPTFKPPSKSEPTCQIDKIFVTSQLLSRLSSCTVGDIEEIFGKGLSDHLPVIADFS